MGNRRMNGISNVDYSGLVSLYMLLTESLPYLVMKKDAPEINDKYVTFKINDVDMNPWWHEDD
jgi:hypothetical protein